MTDNEVALLDGFLDRLHEVFSAAGCNDFELPATPENIELAKAAYDGDEPRIINGKIPCYDFVILAELQKRLKGKP